MPDRDHDELIRAATRAVADAARRLADAGVDDGTLDDRGKVYEAWVLLALGAELGGLLQAWPAWYNGNYQPVGSDEPVVFRGSPAKLRREGGQAPGFLMLETLHGPVFELHNSLQFTGTSGVDHELDICLLRKHDREAWVAGAARLPFLAGLELKCHTGSISLPLVRQAALTRIDLLDSVGRGPPSTYQGFVTFSSLSKNGRSLAHYYQLEVFEGIGEELTNPDSAFVRISSMADAIFGWWQQRPAD